MFAGLNIECRAGILVSVQVILGCPMCIRRSFNIVKECCDVLQLANTTSSLQQVCRVSLNIFASCSGCSALHVCNRDQTADLF